MKNRNFGIFLALLFILSFNITALSKQDIIIDSDMTFEEAINGTKAPQLLIDSLRLITVQYYGFDGKIHQGQLVVNQAVVKDIKEIFQIIKKIKFPIKKVVPIVKYSWSDDLSMDDNNTSAFCYRTIYKTNRLSNHSFGRAIDINPFTNPVIYKNGKVSPSKANYDVGAKGTITKSCRIVKEFKSRGWRWGGDFKSKKDYQHFDKR